MARNRGHRAAWAATVASAAGVASYVVAGAAPQAAAAVPTVTGTLVRTVATSQLDPPIPDPAGIVYLPDRDRFLISDSEVDETPVYAGSNIFETTRAGVLVDRGVTTGTKEAAGIGHNPTNGHAYVSDDDQFRVHEIDPGPDGRYGNSDDIRSSFSTAAFGSTDPEDVTYFPPTGELFVLDGADHDVHRVSPGPNGRFDGVAPTGDDVATEFDVQVYGAEDPEGIGYHPGRGTLVVVDSTSETVYEVNRELMLITRVDIGATNQRFAAGITVAPATDDPGRYDFYIVDRGVDNDSDPNENDGKMYEVRADLPPIGNLPPMVDAGRDAPVEVGAPLALRASVRDDGLPGGGTTTVWSKVSGPGTVAFTDPGAAATAATFNAAGSYVVRATTSDGALSVSDDLVVTVVPVGAPLPLDTPVAKAFDDVETRSSGFADWLGSTLNIPRAGTTAQTIGIRFADLAVPDGATITEAWIQFRASGSNSGATSVQVRGIDQDDTATFTTATTTVTSRPVTDAAVTWAPPAWTSGQNGTAQQTSDLSEIVQEIVDRPGWRGGNALAFRMTGTGERRASSHDGARAPVLHLAYTTSEPSNTPPLAAISASCSGLACTFDGTDSFDDDGPIAAYHWSFSDGGTADGAIVQHTFASAGTYDATLTVTDGDGATDSTTRTVTVAEESSPIGFRGLARTIANTTSAGVTVPSAVNSGDALLLYATVNVSTATVTPPPGWTQAANFVTGSGRTLLWQRVATSSDAGSRVTVGLSTQTKIVLQVVAYSGTSTTAPVAAVATRSETTSTLNHTTPTVTFTGDGRWVVSYWADKSSSTTDWVPPAGVTVRDEAIGSGGGRITTLLADSGAPVPAGTYGGLTARTDATSRAGTITLVLRPQ
jgi:hypothetical protein